MKYTVSIGKYGSTQGSISFASGDVVVCTDCWYKSTTPIQNGNTYTGAATRMANKTDSVTGMKRPGIFIKEFGSRGIFIHEGSNVGWSDNCVVLHRNSMMAIWDHIVGQGDQEKEVIHIVVK